ncbi:MAG TPA: 50S ribosomal protein L35, partial [Candidatus Acidoferrales bacterium]|nr:50S ribosomal protein L35 [Candidatus Acidoferrales bacterium]
KISSIKTHLNIYMKVNKSYSKRLKVTRNGKIVARGQGQNHFNSKESRRSQLNKRRNVTITMTQKSISRFLPGLKVATTAPKTK